MVPVEDSRSRLGFKDHETAYLVTFALVYSVLIHNRNLKSTAASVQAS